MLGMQDSDKRNQTEFFIKNIALVISAIWLLITGTAYIDKQAKSLDLRNTTLGIESNPTADTQINAILNNAPWITDRNLCTVTGQYRIKNTGRLNFRIDEVSFEIYRLTILDQPADLSMGPVTSLTTAVRLRGIEPFYSESFPVEEIVGVNNELQRNFGFVIRRDEGSHYVIAANATGGLPLVPEERDGSGRFGARDLQHFTEVASICSPLPPPANPS